MSIDQAFVQAFARQNRPANQVPDGELQVDPSVADTTQIWVDPVENEMMRADSGATPQVPQPHIASATPTPAVQHPSISGHVHTAYVYAENSPQAVPQERQTQQTKPVAPAAPAPAQPVVEQRIDSPEPFVPAPAAKSATEPSESTTATPQQTPTTTDTETETDVVVEASPIQPVWEVDSFDVPNSVSELFFEEALFQLVAKRLHDAVNDGLKTMMVTSAKSGEGRSTVAIGMAMAAAASGLSVALIDGDIHEPTLIEDLRLDMDYGWLDAVRGGLPLDQVAVYSIEDGLTLIPLLPAPSESASATDYEIGRLLDNIAGRFDLVVIDAPIADSSTIETYAATVDSAVVARDSSRTDIGTVNELSYRLRECGLQGIGIVENFS